MASQTMERVREIIGRVAPTDSRVLILGENGTGKEIVAEQIHALSKRKNKSFVKVNSAAIPKDLIESELFGHEAGSFTGATKSRKGKFEQANEGTLFLDEIGDMSLDAQSKLLRVLSSDEIHRVGSECSTPTDVRLISASNKPLDNAEFFREDLYHRIATIPIYLPPLRSRMEDVPSLINEFITEMNLNLKIEFDSKSMDALMSYHWPGNVRELKNTIQYAVLMRKNSEVEVGDLPEHIVTSRSNSAFCAGPPRYTMAEIEKEYILKVLHFTNWRKIKSSEILGIDYTTLYRKLVRWGLQHINLED